MIALDCVDAPSTISVARAVRPLGEVSAGSSEVWSRMCEAGAKATVPRSLSFGLPAARLAGGEERRLPALRVTGDQEALGDVWIELASRRDDVEHAAALGLPIRYGCLPGVPRP